MRLLYCSRDYTTHDLRFVRAFTGAGIEVRYLRLEDDGVPYVAEPLPAGAIWVPWAGGGKPQLLPEAVKAYLPSFARAVAELRPDLIHAGPVQSFGLMAARTGAAPTVLVSWGSDLLVDARRDPWHWEAARTALRGCDAFFCDSAAVLDAARDLSSGALPPHLCVPWGLEVLRHPEDELVRPAVRRERRWENCVVVVAARAWHPGHRVPELVDAFAAAAARDARLRLALVGTGADARAVHDRITAHDVGRLVYQPGVLPVAELHRLLAGADVYLSLVPWDGTSITLLEAMSHAVPAVVARNAGNADWVADGVTGYLVEGDASAWAECLLALAADPGRARRMGKTGRAVVERRADWAQNGAQLVEFYHDAAARGRVAAGAVRG